MIRTKPVSDLRNKFPNIEKIVNTGEPVYLTKNGYGTMGRKDCGKMFSQTIRNVRKALET